MLQKTVAWQLGMDATVLCAVETGTRAPLDVEQLRKAVGLLQLTEEEVRELNWSAHHDRLVCGLEHKGASDLEIEFFSRGLQALRHLEPKQIKGLIVSLQEIEKSANLMASLGTYNPLREARP